MSKLPLSLQMYSLREASAKDLLGTIRTVAAMGYDAVEFAGYFGNSAEAIRDVLDETGLKCAGTHTSLESIGDDKIEETAKFNATFGNPYLIVPGVGAEYKGTRDGALKLAEKLTQASKTAAEFGAFVGYHNHDWEYTPVNDNGDFAMELLAINTPPEVILQVDTGNTQDAGGPAIDFIDKWKNRLVTVHLKPHAANFENYFIGEDDTDWPAVFEALEGGKTKFLIIEQERYPEPNTPEECVARCLKNLKEMGK